MLGGGGGCLGGVGRGVARASAPFFLVVSFAVFAGRMFLCYLVVHLFSRRMLDCIWWFSVHLGFPHPPLLSLFTLWRSAR